MQRSAMQPPVQMPRAMTSRLVKIEDPMSMPPSPSASRSAVTRAVGGSFTSSPPRDPEPARAPWFAGDQRAHPLVDLATVRENIFQLVLPNLTIDPCPVHGWRILRA